MVSHPADKDLMIGQLKAELTEMQQKNLDFYELKDALLDLEQKCRELQAKKLLQD